MVPLPPMPTLSDDDEASPQANRSGRGNRTTAIGLALGFGPEPGLGAPAPEPAPNSKEGESGLPPDCATNAAWIAFRNGALDTQNAVMCKHCELYRQGDSYCHGGAPCYMCWHRGFNADECRRNDIDVNKQ
ncbi:uncharacterized protein PAC_06073 [Phialocephala subalpina]|uniref:Uncharacterized protein n=1 Tax=Phialocephala subalpina TaxID=576137 RepID=A0A1L7WTS3_9HELO|nr:uncharacterized protein PAC_06073 [Phialocephala subalpina]